MLSNARVAILVRPLDLALAVLKIALIPSLALALSLPAIVQILSSPSGDAKAWLVGLLGPTLAVAYIALVQMEVIGPRIDRAMARLSRRVALACNHDYAAEHDRGGLACWLTPEVFQAPIFRYDQQAKVVTELSRACGEELGQYWFVEGRSGSGKTRTALLLVQTLIRDSRLFELGNRCFLYDFSESREVQQELLTRLRRRRHDGAIILVDNFQLVSSEVLRDLTDLLVDRADSPSARLVVFLARPGDAWNLSPGSDVRLLSEAKAARRYVELRGPRSEVVELGVSKFDLNASRLVRSLHERDIASAAQMHLAQVIARNRAVPDDVLATLFLLLGKKAANAPPPELIGLLGILTALSVHRGSFSRDELRCAIRVAGSEVEGASTSLEALRMRALFRRLHKIGLVTKIQLEGARYLLHEEVAELCVDRLSELPAFRTSLVAVGTSRLHEQRGDGDALGAWLTAVEINAQESMLETFEKALSHGAGLRMTLCLQRARHRYTLKPATRLQLAILLDRTGEFVASRAEFADGLAEELDPSSDLAVLLAASRIEANHFRDYEEDLGVLLTHYDPAIGIIGEYWEVHIATHSGMFESDLLLDLATRALGHIRERDVFWQVHSLARMHFDSLRTFYLSGRSDIRSVASPARQSLDAYLEDKLPIHKAMHILYTQAHLVGHVLLPRLALFDEPVTAEDAAFAGLELGERATITELTSTALKLYSRARDEFWRYGDREATYLQADILNAEMIQDGADLDAVREPLRRYQSFIENSEFNSLNSYPDFYYLRWNVLKHYDALLYGVTESADNYLAKAEWHLGRVIESDEASENRYGQLRAELLAILLGGIRKPFVEQRLVDLEQQMARHGYEFERTLLARLVGRGAISPSEMASIFRFYPFVHQ